MSDQRQVLIRVEDGRYTVYCDSNRVDVTIVDRDAWDGDTTSPLEPSPLQLVDSAGMQRLKDRIRVDFAEEKAESTRHFGGSIGRQN